MKTGILGGFVVLLLGMGVGLFAARGSWGGAIYLTSNSFGSNNRSPAAIRRDLDFSKLDGAELITASQKRLVTAARVLLQHESVGVELGHFVTRDAEGNKQLACDFYDRMTLTFEADGVADSGEKPMMTIEGPCRTGTDITRIEPIWIPVQKIVVQKPGDMDLSFPENDGVSFVFKNMGEQWPMHWGLQSVRLYNDAQSGREVSIAGRDLNELRQHPLVVAWPTNDRMPTNEHQASPAIGQ